MYEVQKLMNLWEKEQIKYTKSFTMMYCAKSCWDNIYFKIQTRMSHLKKVFFFLSFFDNVRNLSK